MSKSSPSNRKRQEKVNGMIRDMCNQIFNDYYPDCLDEDKAKVYTVIRSNLAFYAHKYFRLDFHHFFAGVAHSKEDVREYERFFEEVPEYDTVRHFQYQNRDEFHNIAARPKLNSDTGYLMFNRKEKKFYSFDRDADMVDHEHEATVFDEFIDRETTLAIMVELFLELMDTSDPDDLVLIMVPNAKIYRRAIFF